MRIRSLGSDLPVPQKVEKDNIWYVYPIIGKTVVLADILMVFILYKQGLIYQNLR